MIIKNNLSNSTFLVIWLLLSVTSHASIHGHVRVLDSAGQPASHAVVDISAERLPNAVESSEYNMNQIDFQFDPRVLAVPKGAMVSFPNKDESRHHVYSFSPANTFEIRLFGQDAAPPVAFDKTGVVAIGCNIHDAMSAHIYVSESGIVAVTDDDGLAKMPAYIELAEHAVTVWHPSLDKPFEATLSQFTVDQDGTVTINLPMRIVKENESSVGSSLRERLQGFKLNGG